MHHLSLFSVLICNVRDDYEITQRVGYETRIRTGGCCSFQILRRGMNTKVFYSNGFVLSNTSRVPFVTTMISMHSLTTHRLKTLNQYPWKTFVAGGLIRWVHSKQNGNRSSGTDWLHIFAHFKAQKTSIQWTFCKHTYLPELGEANTDSSDCDLSHHRVIGTDRHETFEHSSIDFSPHILIIQALPGVNYFFANWKDLFATNTIHWKTFSYLIYAG